MGKDIVFPAARGGETNTYSTKTVPIILIPGVMGSRLKIHDDYLLGIFARFWDPDNTLHMADWLLMNYTVVGKLLHYANPGEVMEQGGKVCQTH